MDGSFALIPGVNNCYVLNTMLEVESYLYEQRKVTGGVETERARLCITIKVQWLQRDGEIFFHVEDSFVQK